MILHKVSNIVQTLLQGTEYNDYEKTHVPFTTMHTSWEFTN